MNFNIEWNKRASKELDKLPKKNILQILDKIDTLKENPFQRKLIDSDNSYRIRIGDYRVIYEINPDTKTITIYRVRHRKNIYKK